MSKQTLLTVALASSFFHHEFLNRFKIIFRNKRGMSVFNNDLLFKVYFFSNLVQFRIT